MAAPHFTGLITTLALIAGAQTAALAEQGTEQQRKACTPDAFRLCTTAMPDEKQVEDCLRAAGPRLSRACHEVFYPQPEADPAQVTRGQAAPHERTQSSARTQPSAPDRAPEPSMRQRPPRGIYDIDE